jgi:hypothetical protein
MAEGQGLVTINKSMIDLWSSDGKHLAEIERNGNPNVGFVSNDRVMVFAEGTRLMAIPVLGQFEDAPTWLADLAEATCGWRLNDIGVLESSEDTQPEKLEEVYSRTRSSPDGSPLKDWAMTHVVP